VPPSEAVEDPRATLAELAALISANFGRRLVGLYLFGSLAAGGFYPGRSDLDLFVVLDSDVAEGSDLDALRELHERFESERPAWRDRIEAVYISRSALATFESAPTGVVARVSPGETLHHRELAPDIGWNLDWHAVLNGGETLFGPPPSELGPPVGDALFRAAVRRQLLDMSEIARTHDVAYVPAQQGYIVATVCRALYSLATGEQTSKENAVAWYAERHPDESDFVWATYRAYRADVRGPHERLIAFVDSASADTSAKANRLAD
jgi:predicted nucleotidyltransferase